MREVRIKIAYGCEIRVPAHPAPCTYVRVLGFLDTEGKEYGEIAYWDQAEWAEDPAGVMGAIMGAAVGGRAGLASTQGMPHCLVIDREPEPTPGKVWELTDLKRKR